MIINFISLQKSKLGNNYFGNNYSSNVSPPQNQSNNKGAKKANNNDKLFLALGALALIVIGGISYKKIHSAKMLKKSSSNNSNATIQATSFLQNCMEKFSKKLPQSDFFRFNEEFKRLSLPKYDIIDSLKNDDTKNFVKYILAAKESGLSSHIELPKGLILGNVNSKIKDVSKIFTTAIYSNFVSTKYTKGHIVEFIESLDEFSSNALKKYNEKQTHTFLHFDNASQFLNDLKLKENEQFKARFDKIIALNQENKIVYIVDDNAAKQLNTDSILKLEFDEKINSVDLTNDLEEVNFQLGSKLSSKAENIDKELSEYIKPNGSPSFHTIRNLLLDTPNEKVFLVDGKDNNIVEKAITLISLKTNNTYEKLDCKEISNLSAILPQKGEKAKGLYNRTCKRTFLYLDNLEPSQQINDFIVTASEKYHIIPVINTQNNEVISALNLPENQIFKMNFWDKGQKAMVDSMELMNERTKKNDFNHIDLERLQKEFFTWIAAERSGKNGSTAQIYNGILLHGPDNLTKITADAIKNTVDANCVKIAFNKDKFSDIIDKMIDEAEKAEKLFKQSRKRTILELDGLDNLLTLDREIPENSDLINEFKSIAEDLSQKYHTTIIMRTDMPLDKLDAASIASNRLGMHIEVK